MKKCIFFLITIISVFGIQNKEEMREQFQKQGFLWIENFFSSDEVNQIQNWADEMHKDAANLLELSKVLEKSPQEMAKLYPHELITVTERSKETQVCRVEDIMSTYPSIHAFMNDTVSSYLKELFDESYIIFKDKLNFKWPGGGAFPPHQDYPAYGLFGPANHVTAMIAIDPATVENGCLRVAQNWTDTLKGDANFNPALLDKGTALLPYIQEGKNFGSIVPEYAEKFSWLLLNVKPGDLVIFNSHVPHYSEPNLSQDPRRAMFLTYNKLSDGEYRKAYYTMKRNDPDNPLFHLATPTSRNEND